MTSRSRSENFSPQCKITHGCLRAIGLLVTISMIIPVVPFFSFTRSPTFIDYLTIRFRNGRLDIIKEYVNVTITPYESDNTFNLLFSSPPAVLY